MKKIFSPSELIGNYSQGIVENQEKYVSHAQQSAGTWVKRFYPIYENQIQASIETQGLSGYDRLLAYAQKMKGMAIKRKVVEVSKLREYEAELETIA